MLPGGRGRIRQGQDSAVACQLETRTQYPNGELLGGREEAVLNSVNYYCSAIDFEEAAYCNTTHLWCINDQNFWNGGIVTPLFS